MAQEANEALAQSAKDARAEVRDLTAEVKDLKGEMQWLQLHIKREQAHEREPKRFRRELIVCAAVAFAVSITTLVLGNILREIAIETPGAGSRRNSAPSTSCRRRRGACGSTRTRTRRGTWCCPGGRSARRGP